ncbi:MAG: putative 2-aminoethylphosphonate ABC transporter ATP-binding protein [Parvibaculaceae bacterium]
MTDISKQDMAAVGGDVAAGAPMRGEAPYLVVTGCSKHFGDFHAVKNLSLSVAKGELISLLGPSGCGKTTLLRVIAGLDVQTSGRITMDGRDVSHAPAAQRNFGILFQSYALFPNLDVFENVAYGLVARRWPRERVRARVADLLALVGLPDLGKRYPAELSGGQQQRVALARALAPAPDLLLLDEPLSALDAQVRVYLREEIRALQRRLGITTILVTHDQEEALAISDRVVLMRNGEIEQTGTPIELYEHPATHFAATFVGASTCLAGVVSHPGRIACGGVEFRIADPGHAPGTPVWVSFRPEDVRLASPEGGGENAIRATVRRMRFKGASWSLDLEPEHAPETSIEAALTAEAVRKFALAEQARITVRIAPERIRVFARS